ncbi:hypothetical protein POM88_041489 [Heracleum sosnowskyi]|uniref:Uncharacterized protein n=1 Tax=Heracleum sosnowskyi TaxID=360622 RepID=A0AAD8MBE6_9APIA|nr:hypothetical protein POM88_041489 [Heracleum sosnowskyi]
MMLKRQDSALSSSRRVMSVPPPPNDHHHHAKSVGCMSGIFHLLSRHRHRRKFLTSGKNQEKVAQRPPSAKHDHRTNQHAISKVSSHESPTVEAENNNSSVENNINAISWEERRKLKFDLERCDEDLKELKMIIESIRYSDCDRSPLPPSVVVVDENCGRRRDDEHNKFSKMNEHTSPVSVLDELTRAPLISSIYSRETTTRNGRMPTPQPQRGMPRKKDEATYESLFVQKVMIESVRAKREAVLSPPPRTSKAMIESVVEVCNDIASGEKREVGRMGLVIQDHICRDLIEEFVKDLGHSFNSRNICSLPFQACKRKLCF